MNLEHSGQSSRQYGWPMCLVLMAIAALAAVYLLRDYRGWLLWTLASLLVLTCPVLAYLVYHRFGRDPNSGFAPPK